METPKVKAPKEHIEVSKVDFKPNNYLGDFQLPAGREFLNEARDWLLQCPLSHALQVNPTPYNKDLLASV